MLRTNFVANYSPFSNGKREVVHELPERTVQVMESRDMNQFINNTVNFVGLTLSKCIAGVHI